MLIYLEILSTCIQETLPERSYLICHDVRKFMKQASEELAGIYYVRTDDASPRMTDREYLIFL